MHRFIAIILLTCLHSQPAVNISIWMDYLANNEYIKEVLCINNEKPKLQCNGKCYLMQQLNEKKTEQEQELPNLVHAKYEFVFFSFRESVKRKVNALDNPTISSSVTNQYAHLALTDIFHPPKV